MHQIPPQPAYFRVKVRRRLERIGAVLLKNSVYVLPLGDEALEDFEWLRQEIELECGEATICSACFLDDETDTKLITRFREARTADYAAVQEDAEALVSSFEGKRMDSKHRFSATARAAKLRNRMTEISALDFFDAPGRAAAEEVIDALELRALSGGAEPDDKGSEIERPMGGTWVTRTGPKIDRIASAWLIRRFIDSAARFKFVPARGYKPGPGELRFDMYGGEFTHVGDACTFETLLARFALSDPGLTAIGEIVHDIDCKDAKFGRAEVAGVASLVDGIARTSEEDKAKLERGGALLDDLYRHFRASTR